jgi:hypothetical protein
MNPLELNFEGRDLEAVKYLTYEQVPRTPDLTLSPCGNSGQVT